MAKALVIIHEGLHAYLDNMTAHNKLQRDPNTWGDQDHEYIAVNYRKDIIAGLKEYNKNLDPKDQLTDDQINTLSWSGLQDTKAFKEAYKTKVEQNKWLSDNDKLYNTKTFTSTDGKSADDKPADGKPADSKAANTSSDNSK